MNHPLAALCRQFLKERHFLKNVTPAKLIWYRVAFKNYRASIANEDQSLPTKASLQAFVIRQRERGVRAITCNTYIGAMNAFCVWLHEEGHLAERLKTPKLRVEHRVLILLSEAQMKALIAYKPQSLGQWLRGVNDFCRRGQLFLPAKS